MNKKRYNLTLDREVTEELQAWLKPKGITLSSYINSLVNENIDAIRILGNVNDLKDVSIGQLTKIYANMASELEKAKKK